MPNSSSYHLMHGDCLELMSSIPEGSVDLILCDPPYGTTPCKWDVVIPFDPMWEAVWRVLKPNGACVLFSSEPFSSLLRVSALKFFKYDWIWLKTVGGFLNAKRQPLKRHEMVSVFARSQTPYYPQKTPGKPYRAKSKPGGTAVSRSPLSGHVTVNNGDRYPLSYQHFANETGFHPTQKPVALLEYFVKTYTLRGETVLDFTMGSGSTGVAAVNLGRKFIGIEKDEKYYQTAESRIAEALAAQEQLLFGETA